MMEKRVTVIPISSKPLDSQLIINRAIYDLEHNHRVRFIRELCKGLDSYRFMLTYDYDPDGIGVANPSYGVVVVEGSEDINDTECKLNCAIQNLVISGNKQFVNISRVSEFLYIIFFEYKSGSFPIIRIKNSIYDCGNSSVYLSKTLQEWEEDNLIPYDCINIDKEHIMYLCM